MGRTLSADELEGSQVIAGSAPAPSSSKVLSAADLEGSQVVTPPAVSKTESFWRGAVQEASFGLADEITGGLESAFTGKTYRQARNESRANNAAAQKSNPGTYLAGGLAGGVGTMFVPGLGIAKGATTAMRIGKMAALGATAGYGHSEADDVGKQFQDTATGGVIGGVGGVALEGVGRLLSKAPLRSDNRLMQGITEGAKPSLGEKLVGRAGARRPDVLAEVRADPLLARAARSGDGERIYEAAKNNAANLQKARDVYYTAVDKTGERIDPADALGRVMAARAKLAQSPATIGQADALARVENEIARAWDKTPGLTARELRQEVTQLQNEARSYYRAAITGGVAPEAAEAKKVAADSLRDLLHEHVEAVATKHGLPGVDKLKTLNKQMSIIGDIEDAAATKATRTAKVVPHRLGWMLDVGLGVTNAPALVAKKVLIDSGLGREVASIADEKLAKWVIAARAGGSAAKLKAVAAQLGIGSVAADALGVWAEKQGLMSQE